MKLMVDACVASLISRWALRLVVGNEYLLKEVLGYRIGVFLDLIHGLVGSNMTWGCKDFSSLFDVFLNELELSSYHHKFF